MTSLKILRGLTRSDRVSGDLQMFTLFFARWGRSFSLLSASWDNKFHHWVRISARWGKRVVLFFVRRGERKACNHRCWRRIFQHRIKDSSSFLWQKVNVSFVTIKWITAPSVSVADCFQHRRASSCLRAAHWYELLFVPVEMESF